MTAVMAATIIVAGGNIDMKPINSTAIYYPNQKRWIAGPTLLQLRYKSAGAVLNSTFYICGGRMSRVEYLSSCERLDDLDAEWTSMASMLTKRAFYTAAVLSGQLYMIGGGSSSKKERSVERWDPKTESWKYVSPLITARRGMGAAVLNGRIIVCGGYDGQSRLKSCESYNASSDAWSSIASMNVDRLAGILVAFRGYLYAMGGFGSSTDISVERYDPNTNTWNNMTHGLVMPPVLAAAVVLY